VFMDFIIGHKINFNPPHLNNTVSKITNKLAAVPQTSVFPKTLHRLRPEPQAAVPSPKSKKRENTFSKSRDTREDRGTREMKTTRSSQSLPHGR